MWWRNLNIETEKSKQTVFAQISLCVVKSFMNCSNTKLDHVKLLFLSIDYNT